MASKAFSLVLAGGVRRRLSDVYADGVDGGTAANNIPYRQVIIQTTGADTFIGGVGVTPTDYGNKIGTTDSPSVGHYEHGPLRLSDLYAITLAAPTTLHILGIPY